MKLQLVCKQQAIKDAEVESKVLRRRLCESEENYRKADRMFHNNLIRRKELEEELASLKESLVVASSPKFKTSDPS